MKLPIKSPYFYDEIDIDHLHGAMVRESWLGIENIEPGKKLKPIRKMPKSHYHIGDNLYVPQKAKLKLSFEDKMNLL
jgi:hypothetical protein